VEKERTDDDDNGGWTMMQDDPSARLRRVCDTRVDSKVSFMRRKSAIYMLWCIVVITRRYSTVHHK
jgi:hypothetical protein